MLLDWPTVAFQVVNFLALMLLLRAVLYDRVIQAMESRRKKVASRMEEVEARGLRLEEAEDGHRETVREFEKERETLLGEARSEATELRESLVTGAKSEVRALRESASQERVSDAQRLVEELRRRLGGQLQKLARRILADLADEELERRVVHHLISKLEDFRQGDPEGAEALSGGSGVIRVTSTFDLGPREREALGEALRTRLGRKVEVLYQTDPTVLCGIEMRAGGMALEWSIDQYLTGVAADLGEVLEGRALPESAPASAAVAAA